MRHTSTLHLTLWIGRRASRTACSLGAWAHSGLPDDHRSSRSSVGMPFVTLCVTHLRRIAPSGPDTEHPERHAHAGAWARW
nr:DUF1534 domain-containing protein [Pseudomonas congelans]